MKPITSLDIYELIKHLIEFPYPQICRHSVACDLLSLLEKKGCKINKELARSIVYAEDDISHKIVEEILTKGKQRMTLTKRKKINKHGYRSKSKTILKNRRNKGRHKLTTI